jgi:ABC-type lipoprotein export system ATPase subunit/ABC-type transporter Mla maintaining outer membrane lipid asymmetry permease subunit MlaE
VPNTDSTTHPPPPQTPGLQLQLSHIQLNVAQRPLLENAAATFNPGELTLILGCSGIGKSLLLRILAGLVPPQHPVIRWSGSIKATTPDHQPHPQPNAAVVFQNFALIDELSPVENVQLAIDHAEKSTATPPTTHSRSTALALLAELKVPPDRPVNVLSGGQQQRLAIARAIAPNTALVLYDEPTSGLDVHSARQAAATIRQTHDRFQRTSIIVTHDFHTLAPIADHIILFDHQSRQLIDIPREDWHTLAQRIGTPPDSATLLLPQQHRSIPQLTIERLASSLHSSGQFAEDLLLLPWLLLPLWNNLRWGLRYTRFYLHLVAGPSACLYVATACIILGYVAQDFVFRYLPFRQFSEPLLTENLLHATGFSLFRFLVPILATLLVAARSGAAATADIGSRIYTSQIDALQTLNTNPQRLLRTPLLWAFLIGTPLLTLLGYFVAALSAAFAFLLTHPDLGLPFWDAHFHRELRPQTGLLYNGTAWLAIKLLTCGAAIGSIAWRQGLTPKSSSADISHSITRSILWSTLAVLLIHFAFSLYEFKAKM